MTQFGNTRIILKKGDISLEVVDAVVNAANSSLLGGGGVDGAIHRRAGPLLQEECRALFERQGGCDIGNAVVTTAANLDAKMIVHTVGPVWQGGDRGEDELLRQAYLNSLVIASKSGARSIALPAISTGVYRFPMERAAKIALSAVHEYCKEGATIEEVRFVLFTDDDLKVYEATLLAFSK